MLSVSHDFYKALLNCLFGERLYSFCGGQGTIPLWEFEALWLYDCSLHPSPAKIIFLQTAAEVFTDSLPPAGLMLLFCNTNVVKKKNLGFYAYFLFCTILNSVECLWMMLLCTRPKVIRLCVYVMLHRLHVISRQWEWFFKYHLLFPPTYLFSLVFN